MKPARAHIACLALFGMVAGAEELRMAAWPCVSPDGSRVVFSWRDDIWLTGIEGGAATRLTDHPARDSQPRFTSDGARVLFTSDRTGPPQVFAVATGGGEPVQLTRHSEGATLQTVLPGDAAAIIRGPRDSPGSDPDRLLEIPLAQRASETLLFDTPGHSPSVSPDGRQILFCREGEQLHRKGYRGPRASQIWIFDRRDSSFRALVRDETENRSPLWLPGARAFLFTSERDGTHNLFRMALEGGKAEQLTRFTGDGVIHPSVSADGRTIVFRRGFDLWRFRPQTEPAPVLLSIRPEPGPPDTRFETRVVTGTTDAAIAPGPVSRPACVFSAEGDLWWLDADNKPVRLTETPERESKPAFHPADTGFWFLRDDGIEANFHFARRRDPGQPWTGDNLEIRAVTSGREEKRRLQPSPDGSRIAWLAGNGNLFTAQADGSSPVLVFPCWAPPTFDWSPDGKWLVLAAQDHNFNREILVVPADGSAKPVNLTRHPGFDGSPKWSPDGRHIAFTGRRESAERKLLVLDLGPGAPANPDFRGSPERVTELPTRGIEPTRLVWSHDSNQVLFQSRNPENRTLYGARLGKNGDLTKLAAARGIPLRMRSDGTLHWLVDRAPATLRGGKLARHPLPPLTVTRDREEHNRLAFRILWRTLGRRFYDPALNGLDWPAMLGKYEPVAAACRDWRTFDRVAGMLLGELNASHLTFVSKPWPGGFRPPSPATITRHPGLRLRHGPPGSPLTIDSVLPGSTAAAVTPPLQPGDTITAVDGKPVDAATPAEDYLTGKPKTPLRLTVKDTATGKTRAVKLATLTFPQARELATAAVIEAHRRQVLTLSEGRAGYIELPRMQRGEFAEFERRVYAASRGRDGLILDLRDNSGGTIADHLLTVFSQPRHSVTIPRDGGPGYPQDRMVYAAWPKPLVVLVNQNTFSNAEVFAHAIQFLKRAPLVGTRTAGGVISAGHDAILDAGTLRVPFRGWFHPATGEDLEMNGPLPDVPVDLTPADSVGNADPQLDAAVKALLQQLPEVPPPFTPRYRSRQGAK